MDKHDKLARNAEELAERFYEVEQQILRVRIGTPFEQKPIPASAWQRDAKP